MLDFVNAFRITIKKLIKRWENVQIVMKFPEQGFTMIWELFKKLKTEKLILQCFKSKGIRQN